MWGCGEGCFKRGQTPEAPQSHASQDGLNLELKMGQMTTLQWQKGLSK